MLQSARDELLDHQAAHMGQVNPGACHNSKVSAGTKAPGIVVFGIALHQRRQKAHLPGLFKAVLQQVLGDVLALQLCLNRHRREQQQLPLIAPPRWNRENMA